MPSLLVVRGWSSCVWSTPYLPLNPGDRGDPPAISAVGGIYGPLAVASGETVRRFYPPKRHMAAFHAYWLTPFTNLPRQTIMSSAGGRKRQPGPHGTMRQAQENLIIMPEEDSRDVSPVRSGGRTAWRREGACWYCTTCSSGRHKKGRRPRGRRPAQRKGCLLISLRHGLGHVAVGALHIFHSVRRGVGFTAATRAACGGRWGKPELPPVRR